MSYVDSDVDHQGVVKNSTATGTERHKNIAARVRTQALAPRSQCQPLGRVRLFDGGQERWSHIFPADPFDKEASTIGFEFRGLMPARVAFKAAHFRVLGEEPRQGGVDCAAAPGCHAQRNRLRQASAFTSRRRFQTGRPTLPQFPSRRMPDATSLKIVAQQLPALCHSRGSPRNGSPCSSGLLTSEFLSGASQAMSMA
jgi:hypothetical protein